MAKQAPIGDDKRERHMRATASPPWRVLLLCCILLAYSVLALGHNLTVPVGEAPDETTHLQYVYHLRERGELPYLSPPGGGGITQGGHPPLYYLLAAALVPWAPKEPVLLVPNPHFSYNLERGLVPNVFVHAREPPFPYVGSPELLAVHVMRLVSLFGGLALILASFRLAQRIWPERPCHWLATAAVVAGIPGVGFFGGVFNNELLAAGFAAWATVGIVRTVQGDLGRRNLVQLGLSLGLALMTKMSSLALVVMVGIALALQGWRRRDGRVWSRAAIFVAGPLFLCLGPWLTRNIRLYGLADPMGWHAFATASPSLLRTTPLASDLPAYWREQFCSFWGEFGWGTVRLPLAAYRMLTALSLLATAGLITGSRQYREIRAESRWGLAVLLGCLVFGYLSIFRLAFTFNLVVAQGRYLYPFLAPLAVLWTSGLAALAPRRLRRATLLFLSTGMLAFSGWALVCVARPAFADPRPASAAELGSARQVAGIVFDRRLVLRSYWLSDDRPKAGSQLLVRLYWEAVGNVWPPDPVRARAEIGFVHLVDADGEVVARLDRPPHGGRLPTFAWPPGRVYGLDYQLIIQENAAPGAGALLVGWYPEDAPVRRLPVAQNGQRLGDTYRIEPIVIRPAYPTRIEWHQVRRRGDQIRASAPVRLLGVQRTGTLAPGEQITLTLYWQPLGRVKENDHVFVHLIAGDLQPLATGDTPPQAGRYPTYLWEPGEIVVDAHAVRLPAPLPHRRLQFLVGWYDPVTGQRRVALNEAGQPWPEQAIVVEP